MIRLNRTSEETLALLLWELKRHSVPALSAMSERFRGFIGQYTDAERVYALLDGQDTRFSDAARRASALSGAELGDGAEGRTLRSVFSRLRVDGEAPPPVRYAPAPLTVEGIFPAKKPDADISALLGALERELEVLSHAKLPAPDSLAVLLDTVFKKYLWCLPAAPGGDVSLYDRMKAASAIGTCLLETNAEAKEPFLLLAADFSGIQSYIFSVARTGVKGVAKRLRARSFLVDVMVQALAYELCERFALPQGNIMMLTGGKFYLLLPNLPETAQRLQEIRAEIDRYLFRRFQGDIYVNMAWVIFGDEGLLDYSATVTELSRRLRESKSRPFRAALTAEEGGWREDTFVLQNELGGKKSCPSCRRRLMERPRELCPECAMQEELGGRLATASRLFFSRDGGQYRLWDFCWLSLDRSAAKGRILRAEQLNDWRLDPALTDLPLGVRLMANHLPKENGEPLTFSDLAERAQGTKRIAVLKADVDNLGYLFADGMRERERHYGTISRVSTLSRLLDQFFSGYVGHLLKTKYPNVYSVFSGGDDLFLIGPWDVMPALALDIREAFARLAGGNPCVTLSAAICAAAPKANIALLAERSEEELKTVKNSAPQALYPGKPGRNGVSFLGTLFSWEDLAEQLDRVKLLEETAGAVDISILRRLGQYSRMYRRFLLDHDVMGLMFEPLFHYDHARNYQKLNRDRAAPFLSWAGEMKREAAQAADYRNVRRGLYFAETVVTCYLNKTKEARNNGV